MALLAVPMSAAPAFIPHGHCYLWQPELVWLHLLSDTLIGVAYYSIPITLLYFIQQRRDIPFNGIFVLFSAFIIACGTTHFMAVWTLWHPTYWVSGTLKALTALVSVYTAFELVKQLPQALALPSLTKEMAERSKLLSILDASLNELYMFNPQTLQFEYANAGALGNIGYSLETLKTLTPIDLKPDYDEATYRQLIAPLLHQGQKQLKFETTYQRANGSTYPVETYLQLIQQDTEAVFLSMTLDITERKQAEKALREQRELLQSIFDNVPAMIVVRDSDGQYQWVNREWERLLGWSLARLQTEDPLLTLCPDPITCQAAIDFVHSAEGDWRDFTLQREDGQIIETIWASVKLSDGRMISIGRDITERKRIAMALQEQNERKQLIQAMAERIRQSLSLQDVLDATVAGVQEFLQVDRVLVYQFAADMSGQVVAEAIVPGWTTSLGKTIVDSCFQNGGGFDYYQGRKRAIADVNTAALSECHRNLLAQFEVKANLVVPILLRADQGLAGSQLWGLLVAHQCSNSRDWQPNQLSLLDQLSVQLAIAIQQASAFEQAQTELAERQSVEARLRLALNEKEVLLKEVHHRVKNNLQIVSGLLQLQAISVNDPRMIQIFRESQNRIEAMSLIHKKLYTTPDLSQINVADYIQSLTTNLLTVYQLNTGTIAIHMDIEPVTLSMDQAIPCGLIINELVSNALKYAFPDQTVGEIRIAFHIIGEQQLELTIKDNGVGLPEDFDWQTLPSLGLSLVYDLATVQLDGSLTVKRQPGATFILTFPSSSALSNAK